MAKKSKAGKSKGNKGGQGGIVAWMKANPMVAGACTLGVAACLSVGMHHGLKQHRVKQLAKDLGTMTQSIPGVTVHTVGRSVFLNGDLASLEDWNKTRGIAQALHTRFAEIPVGNLTRLTEQAKQEVCANLRKQIRNKRVRVRAVGDRFVLEGTVKNDYDADRAVELAKAVLLLGANTPTRETAEAAQNMGSYSESAPPVLLDMLKTR